MQVNLYKLDIQTDTDDVLKLQTSVVLNENDSIILHYSLSKKTIQNIYQAFLW